LGVGHPAATVLVSLGSDEIFDFFVDLNGGMLGMLLFLEISKHRAGKRRKVGSHGGVDR
jgi:hypothetical protein